MPVRIYEISKKLGLENKEVLTAAKALGIAAAKVPSSSLDKITAEYLEEEILKTHPALAAKLKPAVLAPEPKPVHVEQKIEIIKAPEPPPVIVAPEPEPVIAEIADPISAPVVDSAADVSVAEISAEAPAQPIAPLEPPKPVEPPKPRVGEKVGFIQLAPRPQPKPPEPRGTKPAPAPPGRPGAPGQTNFMRRGGDTGQFRRGPGQGGPGGPRPGAQAYRGPGAPSRPSEPSKPAAPRFSLPADAQVIVIKPPIVVRELADALKQKPFKIIADLMEAGVFANVNQAIDEKFAKGNPATNAG